MAITVLPEVDLARMGGSLGRADRGPRTFGHVLADRELGAIDYTRAGVVVGFDGLRLTL